MYTTSALLLVLSAILLAEFVRRRRAALQLFERLGIPGPPPHFLWGHYRQLRDDHLFWISEWSKRYGKTFGVFWGDRPVLVTADLEMEKQVLIKQFPNFVNRATQFALEELHPIGQHTLFLVKGSNWKAIRRAVSPAFSASNLRKMTPLILESVDGFEANLTRMSSSQEAFDVYPALKRLTIDNIGRTIFGIESNTQEKPDDAHPLVKAALKALDESMDGVLSSLSNAFSWFNRILGPLLTYVLANEYVSISITDVQKIMSQIVESRRTCPPKNDLLQSLIGVQQIRTDDVSLMTSTETTDHHVAGKTIAKQLSTNEVVGTAIAMFLAGYETTSTAMAYSLLCLGKHSEIQQKLREEIAEALQGDAPTYEIAMNLKYLDRVVREVLRLYPPVTNFTTRVALEDTEINGLRIPAGMSIAFMVSHVHHDEDLWDEPLAFNPDRFLAELAHPLAYQAFGDGPRNCVGMRIALLTIKLMLCRILPKFEIRSEIDEVSTRCINVLNQPTDVSISVMRI